MEKLGKNTGEPFKGSGSSKHFFTVPRMNSTPSLRFYLLCLVQSNHLLSICIPCIAHGNQLTSYYKACLFVKPDMASQVIPGQTDCTLHFKSCPLYMFNVYHNSLFRTVGALENFLNQFALYSIVCSCLLK